MNPIKQPDSITFTPARQAGMGFIMLVVLLDMLAIGLMVPVLPLWVGQFVQGKEEQAYWFGVISLCFGISAFLGGPILGTLSDRHGRRPVLLIGFFGLAINFFMTGLAGSMLTLAIARLISGGMQANIAVANAYVSDITPPEQRAAQFGKLGAMFGVGFILGPLLGGVLGAIDLRYPFFLGGCLCIANWIYGYFVLPESLPKERREPFSWARANPISSLHRLFTLKGVGGQSLGVLVAALGLSVLAQFVLHSSWVLYTHFRYGWDVKMVSASLVVVGISAVVAQGFLIKPLMAKWGRRKVAVGSMMSGAMAYLAYGLATSGWLMFVIIACNLFAFASAPALNSVISEAAEPSEQGRVMGSLSSVASLMGVVSPLVASPLLVYMSGLNPTDWQAGAPFYVAFVIQAFAIALLLWSFSKNSTQTEQN